ncbi:hypothetical protein G6F57_022383 [Rhizopus arrhizus]|nr:hypothetical protein G6F57_022383 [Rhizopus arrhizus]
MAAETGAGRAIARFAPDAGLQQRRDADSPGGGRAGHRLPAGFHDPPRTGCGPVADRDGRPHARQRHDVGAVARQPPCVAQAAGLYRPSGAAPVSLNPARPSL